MHIRNKQGRQCKQFIVRFSALTARCCSYIAMFNYKPQKSDELELRKSELYTVADHCLDGWMRGQNVKTGATGVFPGNYVQLLK